MEVLNVLIHEITGGQSLLATCWARAIDASPSAAARRTRAAPNSPAKLSAQVSSTTAPASASSSAPTRSPRRGRASSAEEIAPARNTVTLVGVICECEECCCSQKNEWMNEKWIDQSQMFTRWINACYQPRIIVIGYIDCFEEHWQTSESKISNTPTFLYIYKKTELVYIIQQSKNKKKQKQKPQTKICFFFCSQKSR